MRSEEQARGKTKESKRGSTDNGKRLEAFRNKSGQRGTADWGSAMPERIQAVVEHAVRIGGAVTFGLSRDGGAYMLTLLLDGDRTTLWFNGSVDIDVELQEVVDTLDGMTT